MNETKKDEMSDNFFFLNVVHVKEKIKLKVAKEKYRFNVVHKKKNFKAV